MSPALKREGATKLVAEDERSRSRDQAQSASPFTNRELDAFACRLYESELKEQRQESAGRTLGRVGRRLTAFERVPGPLLPASLFDSDRPRRPRDVRTYVLRALFGEETNVAPRRTRRDEEVTGGRQRRRRCSFAQRADCGPRHPRRRIGGRQRPVGSDLRVCGRDTISTTKVSASPKAFARCFFRLFLSVRSLHTYSDEFLGQALNDKRFRLASRAANLVVQNLLTADDFFSL